VEELLDQTKLVVSSDEGRLESFALERSGSPCSHPQGAEEPNRLGLPLELVRAGIGVCNRRFGGALCRFADDDGSGLRGRLDARRSVNEITGDHAFAHGPERDRGAAGVDTGSRSKLRRTDLLPERGDHPDDVERRPHRPLRVVLLGGRRPPDRHHSVTDELLDRAPVERDQALARFEVAREELAHLIGVAAL